MKFIGERLTNMRKLRGYSQQTLADIAHVGQSSVNDWELGKKQPRPKQVEKLCKALGVEDDQYFYDLDLRTPIEVLPEMPADIEKFILKEENIPYLKVSEKAKREGIPAEAMERLLEALRLSSK